MLRRKENGILMKCPYCLHKNSIEAILGQVKTVSCNHCGKGHKTGINGHPKPGIVLDFWGLQDEISIQVDGRIVTLPAFTTEQKKQCGELVGGVA